MKDYYAILGVPENAGADAIKKAFRKLALKYHPDKNPGNEKWAEAKFKEINEAYGVLGDSARRREYDLRRKSPFGAAGAGNAYNQQDIFRSSFSNPDFYAQLSRLFADMGLRFDRDFVNRSFFNGQNTVYYTTGQNANSQPYGQPPPVYQPVFKFPRGFGWLNKVFAWLMKQVSRRVLGVNPAWLDPDIHRNIRLSAKEAEAGCRKTIAFKRDKEKKKLLVTIPAGVKAGTKIRLTGMGLQGYRKGDLYLHVKTRFGRA